MKYHLPENEYADEDLKILNNLKLLREERLLLEEEIARLQAMLNNTLHQFLIAAQKCPHPKEYWHGDSLFTPICDLCRYTTL